MDARAFKIEAVDFFRILKLNESLHREFAFQSDVAAFTFSSQHLTNVIKTVSFIMLRKKDSNICFRFFSVDTVSGNRKAARTQVNEKVPSKCRFRLANVISQKIFS